MSLINLIIIDNRIENYATIIKALKNNTKYILFDETMDTFNTLKNKIKELNFSNLNSVGIIQHYKKNLTYSLFKNNDILYSTLENVSKIDPNLNSWSEYRNFIIYLKNQYLIENFDLMACAIYSDQNWMYIINQLEIQTNVTIRASRDNTGSEELGGNWFLETHSINLKDVYFTDAIHNFKGILGLGDHTVVIGLNRLIYGSGLNNYGQLGDGTTTNRNTLSVMTNTYSGKTPLMVCIGGIGYSIVLMSDFSIWGCGHSSNGELMNVNETNTSLFQLTNNTGRLPTSISCGRHHTIMIMNDGTVYGFGWNGYGQLGINTITTPTSITQMTNANWLNKTPKSVSCGDMFTIVLMTDGTIYGTGLNSNGQLGDGTTNDRFILTAMTNTTGKTPKSVFCGHSFTIVVMTDNTIYATGNNSYGQYGNGNNNNSLSLIATTNNTGKIPSIIRCGNSYTMVIMTDGSIFGTGLNSNGQLGIGNNNNQNTLTSITNNSGKVPKSIYCGNSHTIVLMTDGSIYSFGLNVSGQLGLSNNNNQNTLQIVSGTYSLIPDQNNSYENINPNFVSVGTGTNSIAYSYDGITWFGLGTSIFSTQGLGIGYSQQQSRWVAVGFGNSNSIAYSSNGINWIGLGKSIFNYGFDVAYSVQLSRWVAVGYGNNTIAYSSDGINWTGIGKSIFSCGW
jgi:alpha-tubulin suppressor-like RCC1 family protein